MGIQGIQGYTWGYRGYKGIQWDTMVYRGIKGIQRIQGYIQGNKGDTEDTRVYRIQMIQRKQGHTGFLQ